MTDRQTHHVHSQILIAELGLANSLRILATRRLRTTGAIYFKRATRIARWLWGRTLVQIPDHTYTSVADGYYVGVLNDRLIELTEGAFDECDRYVKRFLELRMAACLNGSAGLMLDYEILESGLVGRTCVLVPRSPFLAALRRRYARHEVEIDWCFSVAGIRDAVRTFGVASWKMCRAAMGWLLKGQTTFVEARVHPTVSALCPRGGKSSSLRSDLFWLEPGRRYPNVVAELGTALYPFAEAMVTELKQRGIEVVETHGRRRTSIQSLYWLPGPVFLKGFAMSVLSLVWRFVKERRAALPVRWWKFVHELRFNLFLHQRLDYYRTFNIRSEMRLGLGPEETANSSALAQLGGITVTHQYSVSIFFGVATSTATVHLYFGERSGDTKSPLLADLSLMNGYVFKGSVLAADDVVGDLKSTLTRAGVQRSAAFFEENPARHFKKKFIFPVYRFLMDKVLADPQFGVLIKPKKDSTVEVLETEMGPLFDQARRTGRFIVLSWHYYPGIVARAVDLSTGMLGTSTLEAAVIGRRTVHLNSRGAPHPFFVGAESNIFETVKGFTAAIETFFREGANGDIGRHSDDFLQSGDHYGDGLAGERMAHIALGYIDQLKKGTTPSEALERTMADFDSRWGLAPMRPSGTEQVVNALRADVAV